MNKDVGELGKIVGEKMDGEIYRRDIYYFIGRLFVTHDEQSP